MGGGPGGTSISESRPSWGPLRFHGQHRAEPLHARGVGEGMKENLGKQSSDGCNASIEPGNGLDA